MLEQKDILTTLQNGFVMGKKLLLIVFIPCLFFCQVSWADKEPVPLFELKEKTRSGTQYIIKIYPDGKVHYQGNNESVAVVGDRYAELTRAQLDELSLYFLSLPFDYLKVYEMTRGLESSNEAIDYNDVYVSMHLNDPVFFMLLTKKLDKLINIQQWICFPKGSPDYSNSCLRYDLPDDIESYKPNGYKK